MPRRSPPYSRPSPVRAGTWELVLHLGFADRRRSPRSSAPALPELTEGEAPGETVLDRA